MKTYLKEKVRIVIHCVTLSRYWDDAFSYQTDDATKTIRGPNFTEPLLLNETWTSLIRYVSVMTSGAISR